MKRTLLFAVLCMVAYMTSLYGQQKVEDFGVWNPEAPEELKQWEFFIGEWEMHFKWKNPATEKVHDVVANWTAWWILDGYAIMDEWVSPTPNGDLNVGVNIRHFNTETNEWEARWLAKSNQPMSWRHFRARRVDGRMEMYGKHPSSTPEKPVESKIVFSQWTEDSFKWHSEISYDQGETWHKIPLSHMEGKRIR